VSIPAAQSRSIASCSTVSTAELVLVSIGVAVGADRRFVADSELEVEVVGAVWVPPVEALVC
jgi:hypothetical protein